MKDLLAYSLYYKNVAETLHISPNYMSRLFASETNMSIVAYIVSYRMQQAHKLLQTGLPVSEVCESVGYDDLCNFPKRTKRRLVIRQNSQKTIKRTRQICVE